MIQIEVFFGDMRLEKYTYDDRKSGQRATRGARSLCERTVIFKTDQNASILVESEALLFNTSLFFLDNT
ncbi:MAG: hypothetical protein IKM32_04715 [Clostridia bacterium]|nr:hypothetical protein [Clostridia bacterium]